MLTDAGEQGRAVGAGQVEATDAALEERIAAEDLAAAVVDEDDVSRRMAGRETHL